VVTASASTSRTATGAITSYTATGISQRDKGHPAHARNWSYEVLEREVRANLVYRDFTHIGRQKVPDAKTLIRIGQVLGPEVIQQLHGRTVQLAGEHQVIQGRRLRVDTTVVESNIHYRLSSKGWRIQRESTPPG
jgi:hypothetical protein